MIATALPFAAAVPLLAGALLMVLREPVWLRRAVTLGTSAAVLGYSFVLIAATRGEQVLVHNVAVWPDGIAIPFAADMFSALMLAATALLTLVCSGFGMVAGDDEHHYFAPFVLVLLCGVVGVLLTADLFNLFVFIEVMLLPSYVLLSMLGSARRIAAGRLYISFNLLASAVLLVGVAFLYGVAGTVNFAELAGVALESTAAAVAGALVLLALGMKSAVVPVHGWLSRTYPDTSPTLAALFSGLHTKVGIYAIYRLYALIFEGDDRFLGIAVLIMCATMVVGVLGAVGEGTMRSILAFHMVSQIGYVLLGVALFGPLGIAAGIFYLLHNMLVKGSLFLSVGAVEHTYGREGVYELGGVARREPLLAFAFVGAALSLAGLPPFSGFAAKFFLVQASIAEAEYFAAVVVVAVSLFTLMSMIKIWNNVFWGPVRHEPQREEEEDETSASAEAAQPLRTGVFRVQDKANPPLTHVSLAFTAPALLLTIISLGLGLGAEALLALTQEAAAGLVDTSTYVEAVIGR